MRNTCITKPREDQITVSRGKKVKKKYIKNIKKKKTVNKQTTTTHPRPPPPPPKKKKKEKEKRKEKKRNGSAADWTRTAWPQGSLIDHWAMEDNTVDRFKNIMYKAYFCETLPVNAV